MLQKAQKSLKFEGSSAFDGANMVKKLFPGAARSLYHLDALAKIEHVTVVVEVDNEYIPFGPPQTSVAQSSPCLSSSHQQTLQIS
nr:hypothetical protein [Frigidibacter mobilis]